MSFMFNLPASSSGFTPTTSTLSLESYTDNPSDLPPPRMETSTTRTAKIDNTGGVVKRREDEDHHDMNRSRSIKNTSQEQVSPTRAVKFIETTKEKNSNIVINAEANKITQHLSSTKSKRASTMSQSIRKFDEEEKKKFSLLRYWKSKEIRFRYLMLYFPCFFAVWYAAAILFPPQARDKASILLWDDGQLIIKDDGTPPMMCPRSSICAEGIAQIIMIALARLTAFASYVFMGATFVSKMHFLIHFLSSTYLMKLVPFESLHDFHKSSAKVYGGLILVHVITHYVRYILRSDVGQLGTKVHVSGLVGAISMIVLVLGMSSLLRNRKDRWIGKFEIRFNVHWIAMIVLCLSMMVHTPRSAVLTAIFL